MALLLARDAGAQARVLVDTGHHYLSQNIEQIIAWLLDEQMLGGCHFNDRRYADDDLTLGSIDPYQVFRIFHEIGFYEWQAGTRADLDLERRQVSVARSEWKGRVTTPKGGRVRHVPLTERLVKALVAARHQRGKRVLSDDKGAPLTQRAVQGLLVRAASEAGMRPGVHILRHTFYSSPGNARSTGQSDSGDCGAPRAWNDAEMHASEFRSSGERHPLLETDTRPKAVGEMPEVAGT